MDKRAIIFLAMAALLAHGVAFAGGETATVFSLAAPQAKAVFLAGEFNHWSTTGTPLERDPNGRWTATIPLPAGKHAYKFIVDGEWKVDDANPEQCAGREKDRIGWR
jgi:1,4-alpha-glucan branching enzyme